MADFTHPHVGATVGELPSGYHHVRARRRIGTGRAAMDRAVEALLSWQIHADCGLRRVSGADRVTPGAETTFRFRGLKIPSKTVEVIDSPDAGGFVYGTLPGHPESGEERFEVALEGDEVWATITAFSRPARWFTKLAPAVARAEQARATERYFRALEARAAGEGSATG